VSAEPIELPLRGPGWEPVDLWRTLQSHGFSDLPPLATDEDARTLAATLRMPRGKPRRLTIGQARRGVARVAVAGSAPSPSTRAAIVAGASHGDKKYFAGELALLKPLFAVAGPSGGLGSMTSAGWETTENMMLRYGGQKKKVPVSSLFTNAYLGG
jgi:hypothetical protein